jgi:hypothetical protein
MTKDPLVHPLADGTDVVLSWNTILGLLYSFPFVRKAHERSMWVNFNVCYNGTLELVL